MYMYFDPVSLIAVVFWRMWEEVVYIHVTLSCGRWGRN